MLRALIAVTLVWSVNISTVSAATCPAPFTGAGDALWYSTAGGIGACELEWADSDYIVAMNSAQWGGSLHCGECLRVTGAVGTVVAKVVDYCPDCLNGELDMSPTTFQAVAGNLALGRGPIQWERVACPVSGPLAFRFTDTSNAYYLRMQVRNHRHGVAAVALLHEGSYQAMSRTDNNHFLLTPSVGVTPPLQIRVTSAAGEVLEQTLPFISSMDMTGTAQFASCEQVFSSGFEG